MIRPWNRLLRNERDSETRHRMIRSRAINSFGMVLTRAFACALPVVASDITGYRDVMTAETSVAVPPGDPAALADAVASLLADEPRRLAMAAAARTFARERYAWPALAERLLEIYESLVERERDGKTARVAVPA